MALGNLAGNLDARPIVRGRAVSRRERTRGSSRCRMPTRRGACGRRAPMTTRSTPSCAIFSARIAPVDLSPGARTGRLGADAVRGEVFADHSGARLLLRTVADGGHDDPSRALQYRQRVSEAPAGLRRAVPRDQDGVRRESLHGPRDHQQRPTGLHQRRLERRGRPVLRGHRDHRQVRRLAVTGDETASKPLQLGPGSARPRMAHAFHDGDRFPLADLQEQLPSLSAHQGPRAGRRRRTSLPAPHGTSGRPLRGRSTAD